MKVGKYAVFKGKRLDKTNKDQSESKWFFVGWLTAVHRREFSYLISTRWKMLSYRVGNICGLEEGLRGRAWPAFKRSNRVIMLLVAQSTDSTKINRPGHNIRMY